MNIRLLLLPALLLPSSPARSDDQTGAEFSKKPVTAAIVGASKEWEGVGNVQVTYEDGSKDLWTTKKNCAKPRVAPDGTVGWVLVADEASEIAASYKLKLDRMLVLCRRGKIVARLKCEQPFIRAWSFVKGSGKIVIEGGFAHGAPTFTLMDVAAGKKIGEAKDDGSSPLPDWAKALAAP